MQYLVSNNISLSSFLSPELTLEYTRDTTANDSLKTKFTSQQFLSTIYTSKAPMFDYNYHQYYSSHLTPNPTVVNQYFRMSDDIDEGANPLLLDRPNTPQNTLRRVKRSLNRLL